MNNTANFYNTYVTAIALKSIAWKYYLVFVALNLTYGTLTYTTQTYTSQTSLPSLSRQTFLSLIDCVFFVVVGIIWYFIGVETKGRTLEELKEVFEAPWPPKAALRKEKMVRKGDGRLDRVV